MNNDLVLGYRRPAMLGGPTNTDPDVLTIRWYGTSNYELNFRDRVVLLDNFYDRGPRMRSLGFRPDEVVRADAVLIGHPHYDHISDAAEVALDRSPRGGPSARRRCVDPGRPERRQDHRRDRQRRRGPARVPEFTLRVIRGIHAELTHPEQEVGLRALIEARQVWERDEPPLSPEEEAYAEEVRSGAVGRLRS